MKIKELIDWLNGKHPDLEIVLTSDEGFRPLEFVDIGLMGHGDIKKQEEEKQKELF